MNSESCDVLAYAGVDVSKLRVIPHECSSISTLELVWNHFPWGKKDTKGRVIDQAWFCKQVAATNKLEFLKWAREVKQCEWDEETINRAAYNGNLEMLEYCFSEECPHDEETLYKQAAGRGHLDCLRFIFDEVKPSRDTEEGAAVRAACSGHMDIMKYLVEERKIPEVVNVSCVTNAARYGHLDFLNYLVEEAKTPLNKWVHIACARYYERPDCVNYLLAKGSPEPTDEQYARYAAKKLAKEQQ